MSAYYNEIDPYAAQWLRNLIAAGRIAPGDVDERSIQDVHPDDLRNYTQCHFFAGIGVWSLALRRAGWDDSRRVWTGSCPCQPFSSAGAGAGFDDERHLWSDFYWLIQQCRPAVVFGEQVASKAVDPWIDLVQTDMEAMGYSFGGVPFPSAGVGAPHIRDRLFWVADSNGSISRQRRAHVRGRTARGDAQPWSGGSRVFVGVVEPDDGRFVCAGLPSQRSFGGDQPGAAGHGEAGEQCAPAAGRRARTESASTATSPTNGLWRDADWLFCRDGKWRPVEASPQPLVDGSTESLGRVRPEVLVKVEEEVNEATAQAEGGRAKAMRELLENLGAEAKCCWPLGGIPGLHEAPFLLAFLRQLQGQGWEIAEGITLPRSEATRGELRSLWNQQTVAGASHRRGLDEQRPVEHPDVVRVLSRILARHTSEAWGDAYAAYAEIGFPLGTDSPARVGRLRAYGNAINAEAARVFIESYIDATGNRA